MPVKIIKQGSSMLILDKLNSLRKDLAKDCYKHLNYEFYLSDSTNDNFPPPGSWGTIIDKVKFENINNNKSKEYETQNWGPAFKEDVLNGVYD